MKTSLNRWTVDLLSRGLGLRPTVILEEVCSIGVINQQQGPNSNTDQDAQNNSQCLGKSGLSLKTLPGNYTAIYIVLHCTSCFYWEFLELDVQPISNLTTDWECLTTKWAKLLVLYILHIHNIFTCWYAPKHLAYN